MTVLHILMLSFLIVSVTKESDVKSSIINFKNKLTNFFQINEYLNGFTKFRSNVEKRRQKLKSAFQNFYAEAFGSDNKAKKKGARKGDRLEYEKNMSAVELIMFHGYQSEIHSVQTRDGYVLEVHRILTATPKFAKGNEKVALLHHGLMGSSEDWLLLGPQRALPYLLSEAGYDVWLTNARGNKYSHLNYGVAVTNSSVLWDFSFHEMGIYDLTAVIDYIQTRNTNDLEINFVGHSMGGTALLVLLSTLTYYNKILHSAILLAPLAFMFQIKGPLKVLAEFYQENGNDCVDLLGGKEFMPKHFPDEYIEKYCRSSRTLCLNPLLFLTNGGKLNLETDFIENLLNHIPAGTSTKTIIHYLQLINSGEFKNYDYGEVNNLKKHGTPVTPIYDLEKITLPIILFHSYEDWLCTMPDVENLKFTLPNVVHEHIIKMSGFSHTDFVWGETAPKFIFYPILEILRNSYFIESNNWESHNKL